MEKRIYTDIKDTRHYLGFINSLLRLETELGIYTSCRVKLLTKIEPNPKTFINLIREEWCTNQTEALENELNIIHTQCSDIMSLWNHVKHLKPTDHFLIYGEQNDDLDTPVKNIFVRNDNNKLKSICNLDSFSFDDTLYPNTEYFDWKGLKSSLHIQMNKYLQSPQTSDLFLEDIVIEYCQSIQKHLGELLKKNIPDNNSYLNDISLIDNQLVNIYKQSTDTEIEFKRPLKRLFKYIDKPIVADKLKKYHSVFNDLFSNITTAESSTTLKIGGMQLSEDSQYFLIDMMYTAGEDRTLPYQYRTETKGQNLDVFSNNLFQNKTELRTSKINIYSNHKNLIGFYNKAYLNPNAAFYLLRNFESQLLDIIPLLNLNDITTFEDYCINLLLIEKENTDQEENKDVKALPKKQYTSFQDIFISKDHYNKAIEWLEKDGHIINNCFTKEPKYIAFLIKSLESFGYIKTISIYSKEQISDQLGKKYSSSSFASFNKKNYTLEELQNYNINIFAKLPIYIK